MSAELKTPDRIGPYRIDRKIGAGGMGTVYLGRHDETNRVAAVKVLPSSMAREDGFVARFNREIVALQKLTNPHVVELYESGETEDTYFYAMEFVDGETLADRLHRERRIEWREVIEIAIQICSALKAAHDAGIVHRDLKPSNLLLAEDGTVKLTDFGVAQVFAGSKLTKTGGIIGTVEYMSPEQAEGKRATKKSDLYSLGAVMYVMLTGRPPFRGKTSLEVIQKHKFGQFDRPILYVPEMPHWLNDVVCQLLEKEPDKRFADALVLSRRLQEVIDKVESALRDETVAVSARRDGMSVTVDFEAVGGGEEPGVGTIMRDVLKAEIESDQRPSLIGRVINNTWVLAGMLALLIAGGVWWFRAGELSPEERFEAGVKIMKERPNDDWLKARDDYFQPLLDEDPDEWSAKITKYLNRIEVYELEKRLSPRKRVTKPVTPRSEAERILILALRHWDAGDLARAEKTLTALVPLTANGPDSKTIHALAVRLLDEVRAQRKSVSGGKTWIENAMARAERHVRSKRPAAARRIWESIVSLYEDDGELRESVERAREFLKKQRGGTNER